MNPFTSILVGAGIGLLIAVLFEEPLNRLKARIFYLWRSIFHKPTFSSNIPEEFQFGNLETSWRVLDGDGGSEYLPETIECFYDPNIENLPVELSDRNMQIQMQEEEKKREGLKFDWNGKRYSLQRFIISRTKLEENLKLSLFFKPSDYYSFLATNMSLDEEILYKGKMVSLRDRYIADTDWTKPIKYFSNSFGINLMIITSDNYLIITQRSEHVASRSQQFNASVNEGLSRYFDRTDRGDGPDVYRCAIRGAYEELGLGLKPSDICFLSFGVDTQYSQWGLLGLAKTDQQLEHIMYTHSRGVKDKWENSKIHAVPFSPNDVVKFVLSQKDPWAPGALACIYHTLVHELKRSSVDNAITKYSKKH